ncbi:MAG: 5-formyltetrahydrofolate cyclo-ligase [Gammaproteobacteria bacterium]|nr:5-formyltetrahydrofolate cyclo-ligase [Gammaproteobacteria bacterium]
MNTIQADMRRQCRNARASLTEEDRDLKSQLICEKVTSAAWFRRAAYIGCYLPLTDEVDTWAIIARAWTMKKRIFAPVIEKNRQMQFQEIGAETELRRNRLGLLEPQSGDIVSARTLDIVLTPVVAFDPQNNRVGMGGGYFDRTFSFLRHRNRWLHPKIVGLAFACQKVEKIPPNPWDIRLFCAITE